MSSSDSWVGGSDNGSIRNGPPRAEGEGPGGTTSWRDPMAPLPVRPRRFLIVAERTAGKEGRILISARKIRPFRWDEARTRNIRRARQEVPVVSVERSPCDGAAAIAVRAASRSHFIDLVAGGSGSRRVRRSRGTPEQGGCDEPLAPAQMSRLFSSLFIRAS